MKKRLLSIGAVIAIAISSSFGFSQAFEEGTKVASLGYGFPNLGKTILNAFESESNYKAFGFGPMHARFEYGLTDKWGIGASINFVSFGASYTDSSVTYDPNTGMPTGSTEYEYKTSYVSWNALVRLNKHWEVSDQVDLFWGMGVGYSSRKAKFTTDDPDYTNEDVKGIIPVGFESTVGVRFYFTDNIGAYLEAGWSKSILQGGIAFKF